MKKFISVSLLLCFYLSTNAQENASYLKKENSKSIYTVDYKDFITDSNSYATINNRLKLTSIDFIFVDSEDIDDNVFSIPFKNFRKTPSSYIYDDYNDYHNNNFLKGFLKENDPTRWAPSRFLPPEY